MEPAPSTSGDSLRLNMQIVEDLLVRFVRDETRNTGFNRVVVGLSGGVDSAVAAALATSALGKENTIGIVMPYGGKSQASVGDAGTVAKALGIRSVIVDIAPMVDAYCATHGVEDHVRKGNIMARSRMIVLYDMSVRENALVLGTSNKSELLVGYGTIHGDLASAINPIGDLYKTQVWALARHLKIPDAILSKPPSADLWDGQTDEGELGIRYKDLDLILYEMVDQRRSDEDLVGMGFDTTMIGKIRGLIRKNQFKRRPPVIAKVSSRTVNVDFRYPRDWGT